MFSPLRLSAQFVDAVVNLPQTLTDATITIFSNTYYTIFFLLTICFLTLDWIGPMQPLPKDEFLKEEYISVEKRDQVKASIVNSIASPKRCFLLELPNELLSHLVDLMHEAGYESEDVDANEYRKAFVSLMTTNRTFNTITTQRLYHTVGLYNPLRLLLNLFKTPKAGLAIKKLVITDWEIQLGDVAAHLAELEFNINRLLDILKVANLRDVPLRFDLFALAASTKSCSSHAELRDAVSVFLLIFCPNIEILSIEKVHWAVPNGRYPTPLRRLRKIEIKEGTFTLNSQADKDLWSIFWAFELTDIDISYSGLDNATSRFLIHKSESLQTFSYGIGNCLPFLFHGISPEWLVDDLEEQKGSIKKLRLLWSEHDIEECECFPNNQSLRSLAQFTAVEELHIGLPGLRVYHQNKDTSEKFYRQFLPPNIRKLVLWDGIKVWDLDHLFKATQHNFGHLREVYLCRSFATVRSREERLIGLFWQRGIRLTYCGENQESELGDLAPPGLRTAAAAEVCAAMAKYKRSQALVDAP